MQSAMNKFFFPFLSFFLLLFFFFCGKAEKNEMRKTGNKVEVLVRGEKQGFNGK